MMSVHISEALYYVKLFGFTCGWVWLTTGIALHYNPRLQFNRAFPAVFYGLGAALFLLANRVFIREYALSLFLTVVGFALTTLVAVSFSMWLLMSHRKAPPVLVADRQPEQPETKE